MPNLHFPFLNSPFSNYLSSDLAHTLRLSLAAWIAYGGRDRTYPRAVRAQGFTVQTAQRNSCAECRHGFTVCNANAALKSAQKRWLIGRTETDFLPAGHSATIPQRLYLADAAAPAGRSTTSAERKPSRVASPRTHRSAQPGAKRTSNFSVLRWLRQCRNFILVCAAEQHGIQLCAAESSVPRRVQTGQRIRERAAARQRREFILFKASRLDIQPVTSRLFPALRRTAAGVRR